jgi:anti-sigma regulatory factor (Ser/Thr protein kinase)
VTAPSQQYSARFTFGTWDITSTYGAPDELEGARMGDPAAGDGHHQLIMFASPGAFAAAAAPFAVEGLERGEDVVAAVGPAQAGALRSALGKDASRVTFAEVADCFRGLVVPIADRPAAPPTRLLGEPPLGADAGARREWLRCEAAANVALPRAAATMACAYDVSSVPAHLASALRATHGTLRDGPGASPSPDFVEPLGFARDSDEAAALEPPPDTSIEFAFDGTTYAETRALAAGLAAGGGLADEQIYDLGLAVTELATNAVRHGGGSGVLRVWAEGPAMVCEVSDSGPGLADPLGGYLQPRPGTSVGGWGLWLVRRVADLAEVRTGKGGTTVRMRISSPPQCAG